MTSGASTAGSTLPTDAKVCCKNIAARAINKPDIGVPLPRAIVVCGTELDGVVAPGVILRRLLLLPAVARLEIARRLPRYALRASFPPGHCRNRPDRR